jgi:hypothetical protein
MATTAKSVIFLQQQTGGKLFSKQILKEVQTNLFSNNIICYQVVASMPEVQEFVQEEEPMEIESTCTHEGAVNLSPIISLPEEIQ